MLRNMNEIRKLFLNYFNEKKHEILPGSSIIPNNDKSILFTNAGMNQFKNSFLGLEKRNINKVATSQLCIRAGGKYNDLSNVGYTGHHHTLFEMLGNFSFGDYFKYEAIKYAWELLTSKEWLNISKNKLLVTVHYTDSESYDIWLNDICLPPNRIIIITDTNKITSDNFWKMGKIGPCGPSSEIFYDRNPDINYNINIKHNIKNKNRYLEIWNLVFIQFNLEDDGTLTKLNKKSIDTGMGLERITSIIQNVNSNYKIDFFKNLIINIAKIIKTNNLTHKSLCVIADHMRTCILLINAGVIPSFEGRGYVLRKIIRRTIRHVYNLTNISNIFLYKFVPILINFINKNIINISLNEKIITEILIIEEEKFIKTLNKGLILLNKKISYLDDTIVNGKIIFEMYDTYGFPLDLTIDICKEKNLYPDIDGFNKLMKIQKNLSKSSNEFFINYKYLSFLDKPTIFVGYDNLIHKSKVILLLCNNKLTKCIKNSNDSIVFLNETSFYCESGGQIGDIGILKFNYGYFNVTNTKKYGNAFGHYGNLIKGKLNIGDNVTTQVNHLHRNDVSKNHSATHLLNSTLKAIFGENIVQKGSLINNKRLRFDFTKNEPIKLNEINIIENIINKKIMDNLLIEIKNMKFNDAVKKKAIYLLSKKYSKYVRVITIGDYSIELCGGTHVKRTGNIGLFRIVSERSISYGVRRIEAITGQSCIDIMDNNEYILKNVTNILKCDKKSILNKINILKINYKNISKEIKNIYNINISHTLNYLNNQIKTIKNIKVIISRLDIYNVKYLFKIVNLLCRKIKPTIIVLYTIYNNIINIVIYVDKILFNKISAIEIINYISSKTKLKGGGNSNYAQIKGNYSAYILSILQNINMFIFNKI
ncbi:MAG: alanine--tRNA ligase [Enterobacterales bacterium]